MKVNTWKSHLLFSGNSITTATIDNSYIESKDEQVFLGITIDSNLFFLETISTGLQVKNSNTLARIAPCIYIQKRRTSKNS